MTEYIVLDFHRDVKEASFRQPVLVDFYATWSGTCRMLDPVLDDIVQGQDGRIGLIKIDTEKYADLTAQYGVSSIPDVRLFMDGKQVDTFTGFKSRPAIEQFLKDHEIGA